MPAHLAGRRLNGQLHKDPLVSLSVVFLAPAANFTLPTLAFRPIFACKVPVMFKLQTTLAPLFPFAGQTIQAQNQRRFLPRSSLVKHSLSLVLTPATTICGRDSRPRLNITSILLDTVPLMLANGATHPNRLAIMPQSTSALVQRTALHGCPSWQIHQQLLPRSRVPLRSRVIFLALANTRMANFALLQDAMHKAARLVPLFCCQHGVSANLYYRCLSRLAQPRM